MNNTQQTHDAQQILSSLRDHLARHDKPIAFFLSSLAFPAISCGVYGYPADQAAEVAVAETQQVLDMQSSIELVLFVCFDPSVRMAYEKVLGQESAG